ncbi:MAG: hypothetical protein EOO02_11180 [Chitinophagaceae bacterium]|nr:MAG: hypothetical protein EOO02_11180 [Chitinophagaceae bacterium]
MSFSQEILNALMFDCSGTSLTVQQMIAKSKLLIEKVKLLDIPPEQKPTYQAIVTKMANLQGYKSLGEARLAEQLHYQITPKSIIILSQKTADHFAAFGRSLKIDVRGLSDESYSSRVKQSEALNFFDNLISASKVFPSMLIES